MNFTREQLVALISKLKYIFLFLLYTLGEIISSYYPNIINSIVQKTTIIDPFNMTNITGYVYFSINHTKYPTVYDEFLNISVYGAIINRKVEYCQYQENSNFLGFIFSGSDMYSYTTYWSSNYTNSSDFVNKNYTNPPLEFTVNETFLINDMKIGNLTISPSFYTDDLPFYYFELNQTGIDNFTCSNGSSSFEFLQRGYFYHSATNISAIERLDKIKEGFNYQENETEDDILFKAQKEMFQQCNSGDVRIRYRLYAPSNVTYFGYVKNYTLRHVYIEDIRYGATKRGSNQSLRKLVRAFQPDGIYNQGEPMDEFFTISYLYLVKMKIAFDAWKLVSSLFRRDPIRCTYWCLAFGFANLSYRSLIWNCWYLNVKFWVSALIAFLTIGLLCGIWKIQFRQTDNQVVDVHIHFDRETLANMQQVLNDIRNGQIRVRINRINLNNPAPNPHPNNPNQTASNRNEQQNNQNTNQPNQVPNAEAQNQNLDPNVNN